MWPASARAFCAPRVRIANARAPVLGGPGAFGPPGHQMPRSGFRPHLSRLSPREAGSCFSLWRLVRWGCGDAGARLWPFRASSDEA